MNRQTTIGGIFILILLVAGGFFVFSQKDKIGEQPENDLAPARSQERITEIEDKDTSFGTEQVDPLTCTDYYCFEKHYQYLVTNLTIADAMEDLKIRYDDSAQVRSLCHPLTHVIGRAATVKYPDVSDAYRKGDHFCWSGYYHGVMEGILRDTTPEKLPSVINAICNGVPGKQTYSFDYYNCVHGLGHGVMYITQNELFDAVKLCDNLDGTWERESCYGGVFMENVIVDFENHFTDYLDPKNPMYPCNAVAEPYKRACYLMQTSYVLKVNGYDFADAFRQCAGIEENHRHTCFQSIGRDASGLTVSDIQRTKAYCDLAEDSFQKVNCAMGAAKDFISYFHSDVQAKQFCSTLELGVSDLCQSAAAEYYKSFQPPTEV